LALGGLFFSLLLLGCSKSRKSEVFSLSGGCFELSSFSFDSSSIDERSLNCFTNLLRCVYNLLLDELDSLFGLLNLGLLVLFSLFYLIDEVSLCQFGSDMVLLL
jgi:hypothetical protein